jgi:hypothetical protein
MRIFDSFRFAVSRLDSIRPNTGHQIEDASVKTQQFANMINAKRFREFILSRVGSVSSLLESAV